jgi:hypothetical protein
MFAAILCKDKGVFYIILEGDSQQIVTKIKEGTPNTSRYGHFVEGIKSILQSFRSAMVVHVKRDANLTAHQLVKDAVIHVINTTKVKEIPPIIYDIVSRELLSS